MLIEFFSAAQPQSRRNAQALLGDERQKGVGRRARRFHLLLSTASLTEGETEARGGFSKPGSDREAKPGSERHFSKEI